MTDRSGIIEPSGAASRRDEIFPNLRKSRRRPRGYLGARFFLYQSEAVAIHGGGSVCAGRVFYCPKTDRYQDYVLRRGSSGE